jgi:uncharacterized membrane protein
MAKRFAVATGEARVAGSARSGFFGWSLNWLAGASVRSLITSLASLLAIGVSAYLTIAHFDGSSLTCPLGSAHGAIDCQKVITSPQSVVLGIPVAVLGLVFFVPMLLLCMPFAWRSANRLVAPARLGASVVSIGFVFYLVHAELFVIHAICIWCTTVHVLTFIIFVAVVTGWDEARSPYRERLAPN